LGRGLIFRSKQVGLGRFETIKYFSKERRKTRKKFLFLVEGVGFSG